jgi:ABC-type bacteriocin/lantibiotic exporter with double-glycine peptidase domain
VTVFAKFFRPNKVRQTGDDTPANSLSRFVWRMTGRSQIGLCVLAVVTSVLGLVPVDLQRRIIDGPIAEGDLDWLLWLGAIYLGIVLLHRVLRFLQLIWQAWLAESAVLYVRSHLIGLYRKRDPDGEHAGEAVSIVNAEVDHLGGFAGQAPSQAFANIAMVVGILGYMLWMSPAIAALSIALVLPQVLLMPVLQRRLNRLVNRRILMLRALGDDLHEEENGEVSDRLGTIYRNRMAFQFWKSLMKALLNTLNLLAPLAVLGWGGYLVIQGQTTIGVLVAFLSGFDRLAAPVRELVTFYRTAMQAAVQHASIARWMR